MTRDIIKTDACDWKIFAIKKNYNFKVTLLIRHYARYTLYNNTYSAILITVLILKTRNKFQTRLKYICIVCVWNRVVVAGRKTVEHCGFAGVADRRIIVLIEISGVTIGVSSTNRPFTETFRKQSDDSGCFPQFFPSQSVHLSLTVWTGVVVRKDADDDDDDDNSNDNNK